MKKGAAAKIDIVLCRRPESDRVRLQPAFVEVTDCIAAGAV